ncbi:MAG TPA: type II toxin-antitoxin system HicA family toxin [Candidatus Hydrogenedentes bacterium]|nr:type II toxin-antitoxin system HicA family toxin [Candidatus Hydrogenedentota bacterium]
MKRRDLLWLLRSNGCCFVREQGDHSIRENPELLRRSTVPRHREIPDYTALRICKQLDISAPTD